MNISPPSYTFVSTSQQQGLRLDVLLPRVVEMIHGRQQARHLFACGAVRVNGHVVRKAYQVQVGDEVQVDLRALSQKSARPNADAVLEVLLDRPDVLVVHKPAGQPSVAIDDRKSDSLASALVGHFPELAHIGHDPREAGLVHRLDTFTSGLLVCARTPHAFEVLSRAVRGGQMKKEYELVCRSEHVPDRGHIDWPIASHPKSRKRVLACRHPEDVRRLRPKAALTTFRVLRRQDGWALVLAEASPATRHQVRVHFAALGAPLLGDVLYGGVAIDGAGQALNASRVTWDGRDGVDAFDVHRSRQEYLFSLIPS